MKMDFETLFGRETDPEEFDRLAANAKRIYEEELEPKLLENHAGRLIVVDGRTGDYEIEDDVDSFILDRLMRRHPDAVPYTAKIGHDSVYSISSRF